MSDAAPKTADDLFRFLDGLGIAHETRRHQPVFTVAEAAALAHDIPGGHTKNLFVKDKKDQFFLLTVEENAVVDLKTVHTVIGAASKVSFGKPEKLMEYLTPEKEPEYKPERPQGQGGYNNGNNAGYNNQNNNGYNRQQNNHNHDYQNNHREESRPSRDDDFDMDDY